MVNTIEPTYYAQGQETGSFVLIGNNLDKIPAGAIGVYASRNNQPMQHRYDREDYHIWNITEQAPERLVLTPKVVYQLSNNIYLGGILSYDGETIYWQNDTSPLP